MRFGAILVAVFATACGSSLAGPDAGSTTTGANNGTTTGGVSSSGGATSTGTGGASSTGAATSSGSTSGGSTSAGTTTGGATGTTSGGTTGGGTTTGGGLAPGSPCTGNAQCLSGTCGIAGTGNCCTAAQPGCDTSDAQCGATGCDATGACVFHPNTTQCGATTCSGNTLSFSLCDGAGLCGGSGGSGPCPGNFVCKDATSCNNGCVDATACLTGFYCFSNACVAQKATGPCLSNETCISGFCGVTGKGSCCTAQCDTSDPQCGATDCDALGACLFPGGKTSCGASGCTAPNTLTSASCDGTGVCGAPVNSPCPGNLICQDANVCLGQCAAAADCANGDVCDTFKGSPTCCTAPGNQIYVDNATGTDAACCGSSTSPCQTLTRAMQLIANTQLIGAEIIASVNGAGGDWTNETLPVTLGWGVTLIADGVYFTDIGSAASIFDVAITDKADTSGYAAIAGNGSGTDQIIIGTDSQGNRLNSTSAAIAIESGMKLYISNAWVNGNSGKGGPTNGINVNAGGSLFPGEDLDGHQGQLTIGGDFPGGANPLFGEIGIYCAGGRKQTGTVQDQVTSPLGFPSLVISHQALYDVDAEDGCFFDVEDQPVLGSAPTGDGFNTCTSKDDAIGVFANGNATVTLGSSGTVNTKATPATVQCMQQSGIELEDFNGVGSPSLTLVGTVRNTETGILAGTGNATLFDSTIEFNYRGVQQLNFSSVDLSGNSGSNPNVVACSSNAESFSGATDPGIGVYNFSSNSLAADNVTWDTTAPDYFDCDAQFTACSCNQSSCDLAAGSDGMDSVDDSKLQAGITVTNPSASPIVCP